MNWLTNNGFNVIRFVKGKMLINCLLILAILALVFELPGQQPASSAHSFASDSFAFGVSAAKERNRSGTVLEDYIIVLEWYVENSDSLREAEETFLKKCAQELRNDLKRIPSSSGVTMQEMVDQFPEYHERLLSVKTPRELSEVRNALIKKYDRIKDRITDLNTVAKQQELIAKSIGVVEKRLGESLSVKKIYHSYLLGRYGPLMLAMQPDVRAKLGLEKSEVDRIDIELRKNIEVLKGNVIASKRESMSSIFSELNEKQKTIVEANTGLTTKLFSGLYDKCHPPVIARILNRDFKKYSDSNLPFGSERFRSQLVEFFDEHEGSAYENDRIIDLNMNFLYQTDKKMELKISDHPHALPYLIARTANRGRVNLFNSLNSPVVARAILLHSGWEMTGKQFNELKLTHDKWQRDRRSLDNLEDFVQLNNSSRKEVEKILLPEQRAILNQFEIARHPIVFLTRVDVMDDLAITNTQANKIATTAKLAATRLEMEIGKLKVAAYKETLQLLPAGSLDKLNELVPLDFKKCIEKLSESKPLRRVISEQDVEFYKRFFSDKNSTNSTAG